MRLALGVEVDTGTMGTAAGAIGVEGWEGGVGGGKEGGVGGGRKVELGEGREGRVRMGVGTKEESFSVVDVGCSLVGEDISGLGF